MREIGSEFWGYHVFDNDAERVNEACLLSGRTALRFIVDDILTEKMAKKALLPSYCCDSMMQPFWDAGLTVQFYQVDCSGVRYPYDNDADIVLLIDFFGYQIDENREIAQYEKQRGKSVIYDATHKINGNELVAQWADYSFCSYRKWFYCNYAKAFKHCGSFYKRDDLVVHDSYVALRDAAAQEKQRYFEGDPVDKESFLSKYRAAEKLLEEDYRGYVGFPVLFDLDEIVRKRRENAAYIIERLKSIPEVQLWRENLKNTDVPMFVPVLVVPGVRGELRKYLISKSIYCPIHWPQTNCQQNNVLYDMELSLICDQRYNNEDMKYVVDSVVEFFKGKR